MYYVIFLMYLFSTFFLSSTSVIMLCILKKEILNQKKLKSRFLNKFMKILSIIF